MPEPPLVSIIVPAYNAERFISDALESAAAQTYPRIEFIVVDDGSIDRTKEIIERFTPDPRFEYIYQGNSGPSAARNTAFRHSTGDLIAFLDSDDILLPDRIEKQAAAFISDPSLDVCATNLSMISEDGAVLLPMWYEKYPDGLIADLKSTIFREIGIFLCTAMVSRSCFERTGGFNESLNRSEDYDLWLKIAQNSGRVHFLMEPLTKKRWVQNSQGYDGLEAYRSTVHALYDALKREQTSDGQRILKGSIRSFKSAINSTESLKCIPDNPVGASKKLITAWYYDRKRVKSLVAGLALLIPSFLGGKIIRPRLFDSMKHTLWDGLAWHPSGVEDQESADRIQDA